MDSGLAQPQLLTERTLKAEEPVDGYCPLDNTQLVKGDTGAVRYFKCTCCKATYSSLDPENLDTRAAMYLQMLRKQREKTSAELDWLEARIEQAEKNGY